MLQPEDLPEGEPFIPAEHEHPRVDTLEKMAIRIALMHVNEAQERDSNDAEIAALNAALEVSLLAIKHLTGETIDAMPADEFRRWQRLLS